MNKVTESKSMDPVERLEAMSKANRKKILTVVGIILVLAVTFLAYLPTLSNDFIYLDDDSHLLNNPDLRVLDWPHIKRIFTTTINTTYIPLSLLSFAFEYHFFQYDPFIYHLNNLLLHLGVTALVFVFALQVGLPLFGAFMATLLFGLHPMHVESVCWITERKDVLYAIFYMGALCCYWQYITSPAKKTVYYAAAVLCGILSMLAKPMALTLPLVMLLCDWFKGRKLGLEMLVDKVPHALYIVPLTWLTLSANTGMVKPSLEASGVIMWVWTFVFYIYKFLLPLSLVPRYEPPEPVTLANPIYACSVILFVVLLVALARWRRHRWLMFAAAFYFFSIFILLRANTVVDDDVVADRFMYLPCLGICFLFGYGVDKWRAGARERSGFWAGVIVAGLMVLAAWLGAKTYVQTKVWRASIPFWTYVAENYPTNPMAYGNRGEAYRDLQKYDKALEDFNAAIAVDPMYMEAYNSRGQMYGMMGKMDEALADFKRVIELRPDFDEAYNNIGVLYSMQENFDEAAKYYEKAAKIDPNNVEARYNLGDYYYKKGEFDKALENFQVMIALNPRSAEAYNKRGLIYGVGRQYDQAQDDLNRAIALEPDKAEYYKNRGIIYEHQRMLEKAIEDHTRAIELDPELADAFCFRGNAYAQMKRYGEAAKDFAQALKLDPNHWRARQSQNALIQILTGKKPEENPEINAAE